MNLVSVNNPKICLSKSYAKCVKPFYRKTWTGNLGRATFPYEFLYVSIPYLRGGYSHISGFLVGSGILF